MLHRLANVIFAAALIVAGAILVLMLTTYDSSTGAANLVIGFVFATVIAGTGWVFRYIVTDR